DRVQAFWKALIAASDPSGEVTSSGAGLESALGALAGSRVTFETLPVAQIDLPAGQEAQYRLAPGVSGPQAIASVVPLPEGAPGRRPRLKVIDGTGEFDAARGPAILLAAAGAQIDIVGNAPSFDVDTTQIVYYDPAEKDDAERLRSVLGVGEVVQSTQSNSALDLTITIGADYRDRSTTSGAGGG
ncbi:MAG: LytR C-terminal domain-containing protein, partial [Acidobacteria bacterium]|nr:LytR C-terminal domain-containing protein [Acidobacteriota bacterium]